jgi:hypothetical protein
MVTGPSDAAYSSSQCGEAATVAWLCEPGPDALCFRKPSSWSGIGAISGSCGVTRLLGHRPRLQWRQRRQEAPASLNISTNIALVTYGYTNVWALSPMLDVKTTALPFEGLDVK